MKNHGKFIILKVFIMVFVLFKIPGLAPDVHAEEIRLSKGTQITMQLDDTLSAATNMEGDEFTATVTSPVYFDDRIVIPKGSVVTGSVSRILRPDRLKGKAVLDLMFQSIRVPGHKQANIVATLVRLDAAGNNGTQTADNFVSREKSPVDTAKPGSPKIGVRVQPSGRTKTTTGTSGGLPSVFNSQGGDLKIPRGAVMDITLDRPLTLIK